MFGRDKIAMVLGEFLGTAVLVLVFYTIIARTSFPLFSGMAAGGALAVLWLTMGVQANPAVTFSLWTVRKIQTLPAVVAIVMQVLGGLAAWALLKYFLGHSLSSLGGSSFEWKVFIAEAVGSAVLAFGVAAAILNTLESGKVAVLIGASYFVGILAASLASNALLNPAVAIGVQSWNWTYAVAPLVGALVGANLYAYVYGPVTKKTVVASSKTSSSRSSSRAKKSTSKKRK